MYFYAQIAADGVCYSVQQASAPLDADPYRVALPFLDLSKLGKTYSGGVWS